MALSPRNFAASLLMVDLLFVGGWGTAHAKAGEALPASNTLQQPHRPGVLKTSSPSSVRSSWRPSKKRRGRASAALRRRRGRRYRVPSRPGSKIPTARVLDIQNALIAKGHLSKAASGQYDDATIAAMKAFQRAENIDATGYPTAHALKRLGLNDGPTAWQPSISADRPPAAGDPVAPTERNASSSTTQQRP